MHAYLIVGATEEDREKKALELSKNISKTTYEFFLKRIDEVRQILGLTKLSFDKPTSMIIKGIEEATEEALNSFLKTLEEPPKNLNFILLASSESKLPPTIVSRCQILRVENPESKIKDSSINTDKLKKFLDMSISEKFIFLEKIKQREEAIKLIQDLILFWHSLLFEKGVGYTKIPRSLYLAQETLKRLKANGNIALQLTAFAVNLDKEKRF